MHVKATVHVKAACVSTSVRTGGGHVDGPGRVLSSFQKCFSVCEFNVCPNQHVILEKTTQQLEKAPQSSAGQLTSAKSTF